MIFVFLKTLLFIFFYRYGIYPLTAFKLPQPAPKMRPISPETIEATTPQSPEQPDEENRKVINMMCSVKPNEEGAGFQVIFHNF